MKASMAISRSGDGGHRGLATTLRPLVPLQLELTGSGSPLHHRDGDGMLAGLERHTLLTGLIGNSLIGIDGGRLIHRAAGV